MDEALPGKKYRFLYIPEDQTTTRELKVSRVVVVLGAMGLLAMCLATAFYVTGLFTGNSWIPGGSRLQRENTRLTGEITLLDEKVGVLRDHLEGSYRFQELVSAAIGLDPLDPNVREAGVGGRTPLEPAAAPGFDRQAVGLDRDLNTLLRQARIQHRGYEALLDTLEARSDTRDHLPSIRPVDTGWLSSSYGRRRDPFTGKSRFHHGIDFSVPLGTPVRTTAAGVVASMKNEKGLGKVVKIDHGNGVVTVYAHLSAWTVKPGQRVERGDIIARSGNTGRSTAPHLHYEVRVSGRHVNPVPYVLDSYAVR